MSLQFIEGGAGTGKTTMVMKRLGQHLAAWPLEPHQRVLALTKMHGSRRRVRDRLSAVEGLNGRFESLTIDSFVWRIITRWRSLARVLSQSEIPSEFDARCDLADQILRETSVQKWVAASFPVVVVDELQDSKAAQLCVLQRLATRCACIAAGDPFQDLEGESTCPSVEWARAHGSTTVLSATHRTSNPGLLAAASALRSRQTVPTKAGFGLKGVSGWGLGAYEVAAKVAKWLNLGTVAVITPVSAARSPFVKQIVERVSREPPLGKKWKVGPFRLDWESLPDDQVEETCREIALPLDADAHVRADDLRLVGEGCTGRVRSWISRQRRLLGRTVFSAAEIRAVVEDAVREGRIFSTREHRRLVALTIHQAKNREFDRVIILWPYQVVGSGERMRRLAYNAITRAKHEAFVVVQNEERLNRTPFTYEPEA